ncbi:SpoIIE family protein phosphatase [Streptomyces paromomycinus]|uniref:SpoIIE family protein phosphatase n=1 Tax=Streptomyces paromomycinus TaxID=92743 RepID=UPI000F6212F6
MGCDSGRRGSRPFSGSGPRRSPLEVPTGVPLGVGGVAHQQVCLPLRAGTTLALYTDGLVETPHSDIDTHITALTAALGRACSPAGGLERAADRLVQAMLPDVTAADAADDVSLLLIAFPAAPLSTTRAGC